MKRSVLLAIFFLSGISGLIYQIAWVRQASLTFGVSVYAFSAVLTAYMTGLALGSYWLGRTIDRVERPLHTYAYLEFGIAILAIAVSFALTALNGFYAGVARSLQPGLPALTLLRLAMSILTMTPATILIGATLPVMSRIYAARIGRVGNDVGRLFTLNTAGAVVGCLLTALFLIRLAGLREAIYIGAGLNMIVGAVALWLAPGWKPPVAAPQPNDESAATRRRSREQTHPEAAILTPKTLRYIALGYGVSGFAALGYELVWARILSIHTLHAVYSFALMLTVYLAGLALGGAAETWWLRRRRGTLLQFGLLQLGIGLLSTLALFIFYQLPSLPIEVVLGGYSINQEILYELFLAFITIFPPTFLIGALFPLVSSLYTREQIGHIGLEIGAVSAINTLGAITGALVTGFILIPWLGLRNTSISLSIINLAVGMVTFWLLNNIRPQTRWVPATAIGLAVVAILLLPPGLYLGFRIGPSEHLIFYEEGVETTVAVFEVEEQNFKISFVNGRNEVPTDRVSMQAFRLLGHLAPLLNPEADNALVLSFGNGIATGTMDLHFIPSIDAVDLSEEMIRAAELYTEENYNVLKSAHLKLHVEDGRNYLLQTNQVYDIITTDATHPSNASSWALFTREFYELIDKRLADDGVFVQWLPFHSLTETDYRAIIRTAQHIFPHTTLWYTGGTHTFLVVTRTPLSDERLEATLNRARQNQAVIDDLGPPDVIRNFLAMDEAALAGYAGPGPLVTDNSAFFFATSRDTERMIEFMNQAVSSKQ
jgi:spermidine synthase